MDAEIFTQYQEMRRYADRKYHEAIEHLRLIMTEYPSPPQRRSQPMSHGFRLIGMKIECNSSVRINQQVSVIRI